MLPVISRVLTPTTRARRIFALTLALALGALPVGTSAIASHQAVAHAAEPAAANGLIKLHQPKDDPSYVECVANFLGTMSATPGVWAVCHGYLDSEEYTVTRRHSSATVTRGQLVRMLYRMAGSPTVKDLPKTSPYKDVPTTDPNYAAYIWAADAGITSGWDDGLFHPDVTPPATPSPRSCIVPQVAPTVPHACDRSAVHYVPKPRRLSSSRPKTAGQPARSAPTPKWTATVTARQTWWTPPAPCTSPMPCTCSRRTAIRV